jgi:protein-disulfide isomerase
MDKDEDGGRTIKIRVPKINLWMVTTVALLVVCIFLILQPGILYITGQASSVGGLTGEQAGNKAVDYINDNLVQTGDVTLVNAEDINGIYKITTSYQDQDIDVYITKDGRWLFVSGDPYDTTKPITTTTTQPQEVPKSDKPEVHAFIMSYCPYGLQFLKAYIPVIELLGNNADLEVNFVDYAMHGETEVYENLRMHCIQTEQNDKFTEYLRCFVVEGDYEGCIESVGIDSAALQTCMDETDEQYGITEKLNDESSWTGSYPPFDIDADLCEQYGVSGSPTFVINGQVVSVSRSADAIKNVVCSAFNNPPSECDQELSTSTESSGLGAIGEGSSSTSTGQC